MGQEVIFKTEEEKDMGVLIQDALSPEWHISQLFGSTYRILTNIKVTTLKHEMFSHYHIVIEHSYTHIHSS